MYYIVNIPGFLQVIDYNRLFEEQAKEIKELNKKKAKSKCAIKYY